MKRISGKEGKKTTLLLHSIGRKSADSEEESLFAWIYPSSLALHLHFSSLPPPPDTMTSFARQYTLRFTPEKQESLLKLVVLSCSAVLGE